MIPPLSLNVESLPPQIKRVSMDVDERLLSEMRDPKRARALIDSILRDMSMHLSHDVYKEMANDMTDLIKDVIRDEVRKKVRAEVDARIESFLEDMDIL